MKEIIVFFLSDKEYGIEISGMQSLENYREIQHASDLPDGMNGLVQIRDDIYPVYDMKQKFCLPAKEKIRKSFFSELMQGRLRL